MPPLRRPAFPRRSALLPAALGTGLALLLAPASAAPPPPSRAALLGPLPASWRGDLGEAGGTSRWHLDLAPDGTYQLRRTFPGRPRRRAFDQIGRWRLERQRGRLVLRGGREGPVVLRPEQQGAVLRRLDDSGAAIASGHGDRLTRLPKAAPIDPRLRLEGLFTYMADAPAMRLCATGKRLPVAMERDYLALERAYLAATRAAPTRPPGGRPRPLLATVTGRITTRPSAEPGQPPRRTVVVESFEKLGPDGVCPRPLSLRGTPWRLVALRGPSLPAAPVPPARPVGLVLAAEGERLSGSGGCNRLMGGFQLEGNRLRIGPVATTRMACPPPQMDLEQRYLGALEEVRRWRIQGRRLLLEDGAGRTVLEYRAAT
ncbi:MAG: META domain-containing protein [Synechococcaceae cyanobacterium]|nr:META domain-containing protein [Synechococcaceae cyanobacterium]